MQSKIKFSVIINNQKQIVETYEGEYRNLMCLLRDKVCLDDFGECGGMGRCATCVIKISGLTGTSIIKERNEPVTLSRLGYEDENIRLSCQLMISTDLEGAELEMLECS
jgi:2Fe-2S ferredoxin